jgi:hypothetical protein
MGKLALTYYMIADPRRSTSRVREMCQIFMLLCQCQERRFYQFRLVGISPVILLRLASTQ